jgi:LuxR family transcriptional regulator, maltose regulon positive regulatory protein
MGGGGREPGGLAHGIVGAARVTAFGTSIVAPAASVLTALVFVLSYAGFASPLVVLITFAGSLCCALSISEFARRVPSAGWAYTYNGRGLGQAAGFLTGWMMIFGYALFVPAGIALTSDYGSQLLSGYVFHVTVPPWLLFVVILVAVAIVAYLGIGVSSTADLVLVAGEMAVIAALAITVLVRIGPSQYTLSVLSPGSSPHGEITDITNAMIYGITAFAGFEAAAALSEEARHTRRSVPASIVGIVVVTGVFYLLVVVAETFAVGRGGLPGFLRRPSPLGYLTSRFWSPSALWLIDLVVVLTGLGFVIAAVNAAVRVLFAMGRDRRLPAALARLSSRHTPAVAIGGLTAVTLALGLPLTYAYGGSRTFGYLGGAAGLAVVLVYLTGNFAVIRAFRTEFRDEFSFWRHLIIPAVAAVIFLFPLWGILRPPAYTLMNLLPFMALGWLCLGAIAAGVLHSRRQLAAPQTQVGQTAVTESDPTQRGNYSLKERFHTNRAMCAPRRQAFRRKCGWGARRGWAMKAGHVPSKFSSNGRGGCGPERNGEVLMVSHVLGQVATRSRRPGVSVDDLILTSKVTAPSVPEWALQRPRITELIAAGPQCSLTVVSGPPGAGKTMALAMWAATQAGPVAWVSLDEYDNRPGIFWSYTLAALRQSGVTIPEALAATRGRAPDHVFMPRLAAALADHSPPVTLIVDDFHLLTDQKILTGLDFVLRNTTPGLRLVVGSRIDPLLPLHRYRLAAELAEVRAGDLAFSIAEARQLLAQHGCTLSADSLECLTERTEGWAAGLRLAAISMATHDDADQFVKELIAEDRALTGYLMEEVLDTQPPETREILLSTSILDHVNAEAAGELTGNAQVGHILPELARANAFVQPIGCGWYRYHTLFAEVLRLKLRSERADKVAPLHRRAARWLNRNGQLTEAVRHAGQADDWQLAASMVIDDLSIGEVIEPRGGRPLAGEFTQMPQGQAWTEPQPALVRAAVALSNGQPELSATTLDTAEGILELAPDEQEAAPWLAAALIRLAVARRTGDFTTATATASRAEDLVARIPEDQVARHPGIQAHVLSARAAVELWSGRFDKAAELLDAGAASAAAAGDGYEQAGCLGMLALVEALRGRLCRAAQLAGQAKAASADDGQGSGGRSVSPAALVALAWVHLERHELREARGRLKEADAALGANPDKLIGAVAFLVAAWTALAEGRADVAAQLTARARRGWPVPSWLERGLLLSESRTFLAAGDARAALAAAQRAGGADSPEVAATLACAWLAAGDGLNARRALEPALAASAAVPDRIRLQARLAEAQLSYQAGDHSRGHRSLTAALRLAEVEQRKLPFVLERGWIEPQLARDRELAHAYQRLLTPQSRPQKVAAARGAPAAQPPPAVLEPLTEREREVLRHVSRMLSTAEVASAMYLSTNTVKSHLKSIFRKLAASHRGEAVRRAQQFGQI